MTGEGIQGIGPGAADRERCCCQAQHGWVLQTALGGEKTVRCVDTGRDAHRGCRSCAGSWGAQPQRQGKPSSCFTYTSQDGAGFRGSESHGVHALAGAFNASPAKPAE